MKHLLLSGILFLYLGAIVSATSASQNNPTSAAASAAQNTHLQMNPPKTTGDEVFKNNCGRCHMAPMVISPRITGTVIMHMRVRARLSREDELLLLKYMAP